MTNKFQSYVDSIQEKNKFKLLLVPILVTILIIILNQLLIIPLIFISLLYINNNVPFHLLKILLGQNFQNLL